MIELIIFLVSLICISATRCIQ